MSAGKFVYPALTISRARFLTLDDVLASEIPLTGFNAYDSYARPATHKLHLSVAVRHDSPGVFLAVIKPPQYQIGPRSLVDATPGSGKLFDRKKKTSPSDSLFG